MADHFTAFKRGYKCIRVTGQELAKTRARKNWKKPKMMKTGQKCSKTAKIDSSQGVWGIKIFPNFTKLDE